MIETEENAIIALLRDRQPLSQLDEMAWRDELQDMDFETVMVRLVEAAKRGFISVKDVKPEIANVMADALLNANTQWESVKDLVTKHGLSKVVGERSTWIASPRCREALFISRMAIKEKPEWLARRVFLEAYALLDADGEWAEAGPEFLVPALRSGRDEPKD